MDLTTRYMGLKLEHPLVASASPLSQTLDGIRAMEDGGAAAVVMFSLFEEQIIKENEAYVQHLDTQTLATAESAQYLPPLPDFKSGAEGYLDLLSRAGKAVDIPLIASINCVTAEGWSRYAAEIEKAGAHGLELNIYTVAPDPDTPGIEVEKQCLDILKRVKAAVKIPVALKLSPFFSSIGHMARQLDAAGADALVLFNRLYQPDFDLDRLEILPSVPLSRPDEIRLPLTWIAILYGRLRVSLGASRGVRGGDEVIKYLLAGADAVMTASALLDAGPGRMGEMVEELKLWMEAHEFASVREMKGAMSQRNVSDPAAFERIQYIRVLKGYHNPWLR